MTVAHSVWDEVEVCGASNRGPAWANKRLLLKASNLHNRHTGSVRSCTFCSSLPADGARHCSELKAVFKPSCRESWAVLHMRAQLVYTHQCVDAQLLYFGIQIPLTGLGLCGCHIQVKLHLNRWKACGTTAWRSTARHMR